MCGFENIEKTNYKQYRADNFQESRKNLVKVLSKNRYESKQIIKHNKNHLYGLNNSLCEFISQNYGEVDLHHNQSVMVVDIETTGEIDVETGNCPVDYWKPNFALAQISLIQMLFVPVSGNPEMFIIGLKQFDKEMDEIDGIKPKYIQVEDELKLLTYYRRVMFEKKPHIITGWNIDGYDMPYMVHRLYRQKMIRSGNISKEQFTKLEDASIDIDCIKFFSFYEFGESIQKIWENSMGDIENHQNNFPNSSYEYLIPFKLINDMGTSFVGYNVIDYMKLYKKQTSNLADLPSYSLEYVCNYELGEGKVNYDEENTLKDLYENNFEKFLRYGLKDVLLIKKLEDKMKFLKLIQNISYICRTPLQYVQFNSIIINAMIFYNAKKAGMICEYVGDVKTEKQKGESKPIGGFVHYTCNRWDWVSSLDFASLYPSIISWANIGGDSFVSDEQLPDDLKMIQNLMVKYSNKDDVEEIQEKHFKFVRDVLNNPYLLEKIPKILEKYNVCMTPNGKFFTKDKQAIFAYSEDELVKERKVVKKLYKQKEQEYEAGGRQDFELYKQYTAFDTQQVALKVICNGGYGVLSMDKSQFAGNYIDYSNSVTSTGQCVDLICAFTASNVMSSISAANHINQPLKKQIPGLKHITTMDTDSFYLECKSFVDSYYKGLDISGTCKKISDFIDKIIQVELRDVLDNNFSKFFNAMNPSKLSLDREIIADKFVSVGAKNYFCRIFDNERTILQKPKMKIKGLSLVKTSMPEFFQDMLKNDVLDVIIDNPKDKEQIIQNIRKALIDRLKKVNVSSLAKKMSVTSIDHTTNEEITIGTTIKRYDKGKDKEIALAYNARASILHNQLVEKLHLPIKKIESGDKIMILNIDYQKDGCPIKYNYIAFKNPEFIKMVGLTEYIDYDKMMEDFFDKNIQLILEPLDEYVDIEKKKKQSRSEKIVERKNKLLSRKKETKLLSKKNQPQAKNINVHVSTTLFVVDRLSAFQGQRN